MKIKDFKGIIFDKDCDFYDTELWLGYISSYYCKMSNKKCLSITGSANIKQNKVDECIEFAKKNYR
jgi:hypothetical protein